MLYNMPQRRRLQNRNRRQTRRTGYRAAAFGAAELAYRGGKRVYRSVRRIVSHARRTGSLVKYGNNAARQIAQGNIGKALMGIGGGDYTQFTTQKMTTGRYKKPSVRVISRQIKAQEEPVIFRWNAVKTFDDYGYYDCGLNSSDPNNAFYPAYMYDLTAINNYINGTYTQSQPCIRMIQGKATGSVAWVYNNHLKADGITSSTSLELEKSSLPYTTLSSMPIEKSHMKYSDVRINLWGAKNKAIKFIVQVVKFTDNDYDPFESIAARVNATKHTAFWQQQMKPLTFNPASSTNAGLRKGMKVLKTFTKTFSPTSTTENDTDPSAHVLKWFMKWDRDINYKDTSATHGSFADTALQADFTFQNNTLPAIRPASKDRICLLIKATGYFNNASTFSSAYDGSFDLVVRSCHTVNV